MQKIYKVIITFILTVLLVNVLPFKLFASGETYTPITSNACTLAYEISSSNKRYYSVSTDTRSTILFNSFVQNQSGGLWFVSNSNIPFTVNYYFNNECTGNPTATYNSYSYTDNGVSFQAYGVNISYNPSATYNIALVQNATSYNNAYKYTFGDSAVGPGPSYGDLLNVGFYTKFTNSQQSNVSQMALNQDVITWDNYQDTNGNDLNDVNLRVDIQAASVDYSASTKNDLLNKTINDMLTGDWSDLISISPNVGEYIFTWETVARALFGSNYTANWWNNLFNVFDSAQSVFYKKGWIYRIRLRSADNSYIGNWQIIYNVTSAPPSDSEKVYTNYYIYNYQIPDKETYQIINNINTINNTSNNWYQNDVPFNPDGGSNWLEKLLEFISELIQKILDFFSSIFDGLVDLILGLFGDVNPADSFFNWFSNLFNGIGEIDLTLPEFNLSNTDLTSFNRLVQETLDIFSFNNFGFVIFIPLLLIIIKAVF